jgi:hypothetical protein
MSIGDDQDYFEHAVVSDVSGSNEIDGNDGNVAAADQQPGRLPSSDTNTVGFGDILQLAYNMAQPVANMSNHNLKKHYLGEMIKLNETMKGNVDKKQEQID